MGMRHRLCVILLLRQAQDEDGRMGGGQHEKVARRLPREHRRQLDMAGMDELVRRHDQSQRVELR